MTKALTRAAIWVVIVSVVAVIGWTLTYPSESDPKNIKYLLWRIDLYKMNLDTAADTMIGDRSREKWS